MHEKLIIFFNNLRVAFMETTQKKHNKKNQTKNKTEKKTQKKKEKKKILVS